MVKLIHLPDRFHTVATICLAVLRNPEQFKSISVFFIENTCPKANIIGKVDRAKGKFRTPRVSLEGVSR